MVSLPHAPGVPDRPCRSELRRTIRPAGAKKVGTPPGESRRCTPARSRVPADEDRLDVVPLGVVARCPRHDEPGRGGMVPEALGVRRGRSPARRHRHPIGQDPRRHTSRRRRSPVTGARRTSAGDCDGDVSYAGAVGAESLEREEGQVRGPPRGRAGEASVVRVKRPSVVVPTKYPASSIRSAPAAIRPSGYASVCVTRPELAAPGGTSAAWPAPSAIVPPVPGASGDPRAAESVETGEGQRLLRAAGQHPPGLAPSHGPRRRSVLERWACARQGRVVPLVRVGRDPEQLRHRGEGRPQGEGDPGDRVGVPAGRVAVDDQYRLSGLGGLPDEAEPRHHRQ